MNKQLPILAGSVALTACNSSKINIIDQITDGELVACCQDQVNCVDNVYQDYELFECVDDIRDQQHQAASLGCDSEFTDLLACAIKEAPERSCRSDFEEAKDYEDYLEDLYEDYYEDSDACDKEYEDYSECINEFLGIEGGSSYSYSQYEYEYEYEYEGYYE